MFRRTKLSHVFHIPFLLFTREWVCFGSFFPSGNVEMDPVKKSCFVLDSGHFVGNDASECHPQTFSSLSSTCWQFFTPVTAFFSVFLTEHKFLAAISLTWVCTVYMSHGLVVVRMNEWMNGMNAWVNWIRMQGVLGCRLQLRYLVWFS